MTDTWTCERCGAPMVKGAIGGLCPACLMGGILEQERDSAMFFDFDPDQPDASAALEKMLVGYSDLVPVGHGGMGVVYRARHEKLDRPVAIKVMRPRLADDPEFTDRFLRESRALAALDHPNIVTVYDFGEHAGMCFLVMEFVDGASLRDMMRDGPLEPEHALTIVPQVCDALQYAHGEGVVHRDIKPENILVDRAGRVRLADFGLAKLRDDVDPSLTMTGLAMGTPHYMAPEQRSDSGAVDHRADIYSLGVTFYEMLTGHLPTGRFPYPSTERAVDARLDEVVLRAMEHDPAKRYQQASEVRSEVEHISHSPAPAEPAAAPPPLPRAPAQVARRAPASSSGSKTLALLAGLLLVGLVAMAAMFFLFSMAPTPSPQISPGPEPISPAKADRLLEQAVRNEAPWAMKRPLGRGADPDLQYSKDGKLTSALIEACKVRVDLVEPLLRSGADPDGRVSPVATITPLCTAAARGKTDIVKELLIFGADAALKGTTDLAEEGVYEESITALEWALIHGKSGTATAILEHLAQETQAATRLAVGIGAGRDFELFKLCFDREGLLGCADQLIALGANIQATWKNRTRTDNVLTCAMRADREEGNARFTRWALENGANPDARVTGNPPLMIAFRQGQTETVRALVQAGANVNIKVENGTTTMVEYARDYVTMFTNGVLCRDIIEQGKKD